MRAQLDAKRFATGWAAGRILSLEDAITLALATTIAGTDANAGTGSAHLASSSECGPSPRGSPLSAREREVAALVVQGLTNRQIVVRLVVTERTATTHVEHILRKLEFQSRPQIGAWAAQHACEPAEPS